MEYRKVLLYHSFAKSEGKKLKKYPLLDLLAANLELKLDQVSGFVAEYKLQKHHNKIVTSYFKLLKIKSNQKKIARLLDPEIFNDDTLKRGILSITLDFNSVEDRFNCMNKWICLAIEETKFNKTNAILKELEIDTQLITRFHNLLDANEEELTIELATKRSFGLVQPQYRPTNKKRDRILSAALRFFSGGSFAQPSGLAPFHYFYYYIQFCFYFNPIYCSILY